MALKHAFQSAKADGTDATLVQPSAWNADHTIDANGATLTAQTGVTDPTPPAAGNGILFSRDFGGSRVLPTWIGPAGADFPLQSHLGFNRVTMLYGQGAAVASFGPHGGVMTSGTYSNGSFAATNLLTSIRRFQMTSAATTGSMAYVTVTGIDLWRGNAAGLGGFFTSIRFATETLQGSERGFVGLLDTNVAPSNVDPTTNTVGGKVGVGFAAVGLTYGNWKLINNVAGTAPTVVDLGTSFAVNSTSLYQLDLCSAPNGSVIAYRMVNLSTGAVASGSLSTNIPTNSTYLKLCPWVTNNTTAAAVALTVARFYTETDF